MVGNFEFNIKKIDFDENYWPSVNTRITTNFANLARGASRKANLINTLVMIDNRFNSLAYWDNENGDRYAVDIEIISISMSVGTSGDCLPLIEVLRANILDKKTNERTEGIVGNNFSSYVRDYDFSVLLMDHNAGKAEFSTPDGFGNLHGNLFKCFVNSKTYKENFKKPPVICLSVSSNKVYQRTGNHHPVLGFEYQQNGYSLTDEYFKKMGLQVRYFMPVNSAAPLAFYYSGDLLGDYTNLELIGTISLMETFQKIYRPEIYNANCSAGKIYRPSLKHQDYSLTRIVYDREERSQLALQQGRFVEERLMKPYQAILEQWSANYTH